MPEFFRYVTPVTRADATGLVAAVYAQSKAELGRLAEPLMILSPAPDLLAATWASLRESQLVGRAPRAAKEAVAAAVAQANRCPWCVDAHTTLIYAAGQPRLADAVLRDEPAHDPAHTRLLAWAHATGTPDAPEPAAPPFPADHAAEYLGTALTYHFLTRMVSALLIDTFLPASRRLQTVLRRAGGRYFARTVRRERQPGASLPLLSDRPSTAAPVWAGPGDTPIGRAMAALRAATAPGATLLTDAGQAAVRATVAGWDGSHPPLSSGWLERPLAGLPKTDRPAARLALLAAIAPYRITDAHVAELRRVHPADADLVRLLAWGAAIAVDRIETWVTAEPRAAKTPGTAGR
jgi:AhpD family alkylhydroperoxidase